MRKNSLLVLFVLSIFLISCNNDPKPDFTIELEKEYCAAPCDVRFTNTSEDAEFYEWDFGNGKMSNSFSPHTTYAIKGTYSVTMTATNEEGISTSVSKTVVVPGNATKVVVEKTILRQFPLKDFFDNTWDEPGVGEAPDIFPEFTNSSSVTYFTLEDQVVNDVTATNLPLEWESNFEISTLNREHYIDIMDKDVEPDANDITGYVIFNPKDYTIGSDRYPSSVTINRQDLTIVELDLRWLE